MKGVFVGMVLGASLSLNFYYLSQKLRKHADS